MYDVFLCAFCRLYFLVGSFSVPGQGAGPGTQHMDWTKMDHVLVHLSHTHCVGSSLLLVAARCMMEGSGEKSSKLYDGLRKM